jgi:hypothetical protein
MAGDRARADLGFGGALDDFDLTQWQPKSDRAAPAPQERQQTRQTAEALGFRSREAAPTPVGQGGATVVRRRRTGRNQQFNLKARPETIEAYCRIADAHGWGLGETLEYAVALLEERYTK